MKDITYKRYIETFHVLEKYSEEYDHQLRHLLKTAGGLRNGFSMLDIGAGTGNFAKSFLASCEKKASSYTAMEPSEDHVALIEKNFRGFTPEKNIIRDKFTPKTAFAGKFDLIVMSHCVYWFAPNLDKHLLNAARFLNAKGRLVIYVQAPASFCYILNSLFRETHPGYSGYNLHSVSSRQVTDALEKHGIGHEITYLPGALKSGEIFMPKNRKLLHDIISFTIFAEAQALKAGELKFMETILRLLAYKAGNEIKLNMSVGAITVKPKSSGAGMHTPLFLRSLRRVLSSTRRSAPARRGNRAHCPLHGHAGQRFRRRFYRFARRSLRTDP